jgi:hypothetical protein
MPPRIHSTCTLPGCANPHYATGLCRGHYVSRRAAAVRAASHPIHAPAPCAVPPAPAPFYATAAQVQAREAQRAADVPAPPAPPSVPPAPVLTPARATPDVPAPPGAPMLPIIPAPPGVPLPPPFRKS